MRPAAQQQAARMVPVEPAAVPALRPGQRLAVELAPVRPLPLVSTSSKRLARLVAVVRALTPEHRTCVTGLVTQQWVPRRGVGCEPAVP